MLVYGAHIMCGKTVAVSEILRLYECFGLMTLWSGFDHCHVDLRLTFAAAVDYRKTPSLGFAVDVENELLGQIVFNLTNELKRCDPLSHARFPRCLRKL